ncbi:YrzI family small protein [Brevibacillus sp. TJ4]|uniref:YrzI family small protein n=1 Tax=Brevibacillus sp. TJ4 TaxID=3234853 RepID=UPI0037D6D970
MYIPLLFFTITIERRKLTPEQKLAEYKKKRAYAEWEQEKNYRMSQYPEYWMR